MGAKLGSDRLHYRFQSGYITGYKVVDLSENHEEPKADVFDMFMGD